MITVAEAGSQQRMRRESSASRVVVLILFLALLAFFSSRGSFKAATREAQTSPNGDRLKDPQFIAEGAKLFAPVCGNAYCHGAGGKGGGAPRLRGRGLEPAYLFKTISSGIAGTAMLSFKSEFSDEQIWKVVAFIMSDTATSPVIAAETSAPDKASVAPPRAPDPTSQTMIGIAEKGRALFFDSPQNKSCHSCHSLNGEGTAIGPDLSRLSNETPRELLLKIVLTRQITDPRFATLNITLSSGDKIVGVKKEEDGDSIRIYDTTELPAVLRTVRKAEIVKLETSNESVMPKDYASIYSMKQLLDLITFLKAPKTTVTLKDLFQ
jgi:putative heme-binding domain-containing protein